MSQPVDARLALAAVGAWAICLVTIYTAWFFYSVLGAGSCALITVIWRRRSGKHRQQWRGWVSLTVFLSSTISVCVGVVAEQHVTAREVAMIRAQQAVAGEGILHVRLTSEVAQTKTGYGAHAQVKAVLRSNAQTLRFPVYLIDPPLTWSVGTEAAVSGTLDINDGIRAFYRISEVSWEGDPQGFNGVVSRLRHGVREASRPLPQHAQGLIPGVSIGDDRRLPTKTKEAMVTTSLTHITAVSGAHIAIVIGTVMMLLGRLPRLVQVLTAGVVLFLLVLLVLPTPSVLRAAGMGLITLVAMGTRRPRLGLPVLFTTVITLLAFDPWLAASIGFALSVSATLGILLMTHPITRLLGGGVFARVAAVPIAAQVVCAPLLLTFDSTIATYAVPANILAVPFLAPTTILGLVAAVCSVFSPKLATGFAGLASIFTSWIAGVAELFARMPGAKIPWFHGTMGVVSLIALTVISGWGLYRILVRRT